jgi:hypothetical protein
MALRRGARAGSSQRVAAVWAAVPAMCAWAKWRSAREAEM